MQHSLGEAMMRALLALLALFGLAGIVFGVITIIIGVGEEPFSSENYGGPGPIIAGVVLLAVSLYLLSIWPKDGSTSRGVRHR